MTHKLIKTDNYLLVVDDSEIKKGDWFYYKHFGEDIISRANENTDLLNLNVSDKFFRKIIACLPLNGSPILEGVPLLPPIEDDVEISQWVYDVTAGIDDSKLLHDAKLFLKDGYNKAREKYKYTEEDVRKAFIAGESRWGTNGEIDTEPTQDEFIQSLHQYPTEFECEMESGMWGQGHYITYEKTITTTNGIQWVGKYK